MTSCRRVVPLSGCCKLFAFFLFFWGGRGAAVRIVFVNRVLEPHRLTHCAHLLLHLLVFCSQICPNATALGGSSALHWSHESHSERACWAWRTASVTAVEARQQGRVAGKRQPWFVGELRQCKSSGLRCEQYDTTTAWEVTLADGRLSLRA